MTDDYRPQDPFPTHEAHEIAGVLQRHPLYRARHEWNYIRELQKELNRIGYEIRKLP